MNMSNVHIDASSGLIDYRVDEATVPARGAVVHSEGQTVVRPMR